MRTVIAALLLCPVLGVSPASAHAILTGSAPASGATVAPGSQHIVLRYNSRVDASRSRVVLLGSPPVTLPVTLPVVAAGPAELAVTAGLPPGRQTLRWQVLAIDGHVTRGDLSFFVAAR